MYYKNKNLNNIVSNFIFKAKGLRPSVKKICLFALNVLYASVKIFSLTNISVYIYR